MEKQFTFKFSNQNEPRGWQGFILRWLILSVAAFCTAYMLPGVYVNGFSNALLVVAIIAILNATLWPLLVLISLPVILLTLGFFLLVLNAFIILLVDWILEDFSVDGFWWAFLFSIIMSLLAGFMRRLILKPNTSQNH